MINGERVYLAAIEKSDLPILLDWRNKEDFRKYFREYREISIDMQNQWYESKISNSHSDIMFSIKRVTDDELLGSCGLCYINWIHIICFHKNPKLSPTESFRNVLQILRNTPKPIIYLFR